MANTYLSPEWKRNMIFIMDNAKQVGAPHLNVTTSITTAQKWLVLTLAARNLSFKIHNLGCGIKRITTDTDSCPCCKRKF